MTIAFGTIGARSAGGTTTISVAMPASGAAGDMYVAGRCAWVAVTVTCTDEASWTPGGDLHGGVNTSADDHTTRARIDYRSDVVPGTTTFDQAGTPNGACGVCARYTKTDALWNTEIATGTDDTHADNRSVTASTAISFQPGDMLVAVAACDTDAAVTISAPALTASGITFDTTTSRQGTATGVTTGSDGNVFLFDALVTAGTDTVAPTLAFTAAASQCGPVSFLRLREVPAGPPIIPTMATRTPV